MGTDLHAPLGTRGKPPPRGRFPFGVIAGALAVVLVGAFSVWTMTSSRDVKPVEIAESQTQDAKTDDKAADQAPQADPAVEGKDKADPGRRPLDGAKIESTRMDDGTVVNKITPQKRDTDGPVIIDAQANRDTDPRTAGLPIDALLEDSPTGRLPIIGPDGTRPMDAYARPWSGARGTRIAIVVGGLGLSQTGTQKAIRTLPEEITLGFAASGNSLMRWMQEGRRTGHEVLLQIPLEPFDYPANDPGRLTLLTSSGAEENIDRLHEALSQITNYTGVMNYQGGRFLASADAMEPVMRDLGARGLLFLDDGSSNQSLSGTMAKVFSMPHAFADVELDGQLDKGSILAKLDELERVAQRKGQAIGVGSGFDETIDAISEWAPEAARRGIEIVGVSALATVPN